MTISLMPMFACLFVTSFYLVYLKASDVEISDSYFLQTIFSVIVAGSLFGMVLNELLVWKTGGRFKIKRLFFRWVIVGSYLLLFIGIYAVLSIVFPFAAVIYLLLFGALTATWIFVIIALKEKHLFSKLDRAE